ncbi:efflux RND transporter periplasmic adaptor subunit [Aurantimonas sp. VKM B-3413]|uniref:efflux RND transporter periplasmic adaptor subunit n=1 Tax=Aurantimonas sp. VKM B-3413 TaxID=2779401 RepID=UPI001E4F5557|nr:efflux RND transporter periplasmic adaptor subunit [Aurantimonas sp. VKM B-3413]MCB8838112.1 efflux RND transporter periplasmic adaptor subunit [Aurantimonas sp. VKM B-3413]
MAFLKQILVTILVLLLAGAIYLKFEPSAARPLLESDLPIPQQVRSLIVWLAPEASGPAPVAATEAGSRGGRGGRDRGATLVVADPVEIGRTQTQMRAIGTGEAARSVTVYPDNTTGIIQSVEVESGDEVKAGDILVRLERQSEEVALARAQIALDSAQAKLDRYEKLAKSRTITAVEVNDVIRDRDNARLDVKTAEITLGKRDIRAPIAGRVGILKVDKGDLITSQSVVATIDDRDEIKVVFYTPESFVEELKIGMPLKAISTARPDKTYEGKISAIDSRLDEASRTLRTEAMVENSSDALRPGMSFTVSLSLEGQEFLSVDPMSVVWERTGPVVWKIADGKAVKVPVAIVERSIDRVLVSSNNLSAGDRVVVEGIQSVREGAPLKIQNEAGQNRDTPAPTDRENRPAAPAPSADGSGASGKASEAAAAQNDGFGLAAAHAAVLGEGAATPAGDSPAKPGPAGAGADR